MIQNLDVWQQSGGQNYALDEYFTVNVMGDYLDLKFATIAQPNVMVSAIQIIGV